MGRAHGQPRAAPSRRRCAVDASNILEAWATFYAAVANVSAALVGLVFVAVSIRVGRRSLEGRSRALGTMTCVALLHPLFASLAMLLPVSLRIRGAGLLVLASVGIVGTIAIDRYEIRQPYTARRFTFVYRFLIPLAAATILAASAILLVSGARVGLDGPPISIFLMLIVGTQNAWDLLIAARDVGVIRSAAPTMQGEDEHLGDQDRSGGIRDEAQVG